MVIKNISVLRYDWKTTKMHRFLGEDVMLLWYFCFYLFHYDQKYLHIENVNKYFSGLCVVFYEGINYTLTLRKEHPVISSLTYRVCAHQAKSVFLEKLEKSQFFSLKILECQFLSVHMIENAELNKN